MEHPHAWVLRAIADGEPVSEFEVYRAGFTHGWSCASNWTLWIIEPKGWEFRRKQKTIKVNGFDVPEPLREPLKNNVNYCIPDPKMEDLFDYQTWTGHRLDMVWLSRGLIHLTKENAIAHAKAMLGIDPNT
jgi:hypothetical protein